MKLEWQNNPPKPMTWYEAMKYAELLGNGWRLPRRAELIDACDNKIKSFEDSYYWSSSMYAQDTSYAWNVDFSNGDVCYSSKTNSGYVRCVRDIKENKKMYYDKEENEFKKVGARYLVKKQLISQDRILELTILEITEKAIKVKWDNGGVEWYLKNSFDYEFIFIEELKDPVFSSFSNDVYPGTLNS